MTLPTLLALDTATDRLASRYSVSQSLALAGITRGSSACARPSPRTSQPASISAATSPEALGKAESISSVSIDPQMPVRRILALTASSTAFAGSAAPSI